MEEDAIDVELGKRAVSPTDGVDERGVLLADDTPQSDEMVADGRASTAPERMPIEDESAH